jgi:hypothetical protein
VLGFDIHDESLLEVLSFQQGNQRRNHHVTEKGDAGMVSLIVWIYHYLEKMLQGLEISVNFIPYFFE